jgi:glycosyltransferase involved in cell wall biosynthesis
MGAVRLDAARTVVVPNGIDARRFADARPSLLRAELGLQADQVLIGAVGNVRPSKAYDVLLHACAALARNGNERFVCVIAGQPTGVLYERLVALHAELELGDRVRFVGFRDDVPALMRSLDIYVSSSSVEGFSLTTIEAMASGVPVVATRSGGPQEIIEDGVDGLLVPVGAPERLADALRELIGDPERRRALATAARDAVTRRYTIDAKLDSYEALYERARDERGRRASRPRRVAATA